MLEKLSEMNQLLKGETNDGELSTSGANEVMNMVHSPFPTTFDYAIQRYYTQYIIRNCKNIEGNNCRLLQHSNSIIVLTLDPSHIALREGAAQLDKISFGSSRSQGTVFPSPIKVVGKRKKNAMICHADMRMCTITLKDGSVFPIPACVNGFVLEFNELLIQHPELLVQVPLGEGFLAVIDANTKNNFQEMEKVWTATCGESSLEVEE